MNNPELIPGREYDLWRDGEYIGIATFVKDNNMSGFVQKVEDPEYGVINEVFIADKWELRS